MSSASGQVSAAQAIFNQIFESSPGLAKAGVCGMAGSTRSNYNETILENSQEHDSPQSASKSSTELIADPREAMALINKNPELLKLADEKGLNLANLAQDMVLVSYKKGDLIIDYGESN